MEHTGTQSCQIQHFIVSDLLELACRRNLAGICRVHSIYIRINLTGICMKCRCQGNCCSIGTASSKCCIIIVFIDSLEACHNNNLVIFQFSFDSLSINPLKSCVAMDACGMHGNLKCIQRNGRNTQFIKGHSHQGHRHLLSDRKKHIHFTFRRLLVDVFCHGDKFIRIFTHSRKNNYHIIAFFVFLYTSSGNIKNTLFICYGSTAEFLYY